MNRRRILTLFAMMALAMALLPGNVVAQQRSLKEQLIGTWTLIEAADVYENGRKVNDWGPTVKGAASFDADGRFIWVIVGAEITTASSSPRVATRMVVAYYGSYTVDEAKKTITYTTEGGTNSSLDGFVRTAALIVNGNEMTQNSASVSTPRGKIAPQTIFRRGK
jgi:hypothetical protein